MSESLEKITALKTICEQFDRIQLKLNENTLESGQGVKIFQHTENGKLTGFLGVYDFGVTAEVCGMVHPDFRRQGIFTALFKEALHFISEGGYKTVLLNTPASSASGQAFIKKTDATYKMTEYQMKWDQKELPATSEKLNLRKAQSADRAFQIDLDADGFSIPREEVEQFFDGEVADDLTISYIIEWEGQPAGKLRIHFMNEHYWIYGFVVSQELRGKGIGRNALLSVLHQLQGEGREIHLEVEAENKGPLKLYESCGFEVYHAQDYYTYIW
ncbi:GNAT family N-acetyltransferase [Jeotgalibacillus haloalkalitolerans]|uniref:GNAT family N-acetyltransferase n=1 Tax=Jeotgalibacillus haloalkalitolerans TaxID=3104292 RepID=A0ABU5KHR3_9BACL|nr:GNAT family N-acetyltransferase [Jeotgalibacillus sp. HH7-29]MDZ5710763.1 GNAT family N-acetyltransferase [Jeotgalibacillus sp. HH7-29]